MATNDDDINLDDPAEGFDPKRETNAVTSRPKECDEAIEELKLVLDAEGDQRELEDDDLAFDAGDQWPEEVKISRGRQVIDNVEIPPRPMLTIPKLNQPVQLVVNQQRKAHLGISVHAQSEDAERETAEVLDGLMRHIQNKSNASLARNWSFERTAKAGRGYYRILAQYCDHQGTGYHWSDQELVIKRILNQGSVYLDPYATEPDWSDGTFALIGGFLSVKTYKKRWPNSRMAREILTEDEFDLDDSLTEPDWMSDNIDGKGQGHRGVRVMERFVVQTKNRFRIAYTDKDGSKLIEEYVDDTFDDKQRSEYMQSLGDRVRAKRETAERSIKWMKLNAVEVLEQEDWPGQWIPIIPMIAVEQFFKNIHRWVGMIRPSKDGARLFNYAATAAVEKEALDTKAPYIGYEGQFKGHESAWTQSATRNFPYLQVAPVSIGGQPAPFPQRNVASPNLTGSLALLEAADNFIKATTFTYDPSLGDSPSADSGRKVLALQQQSDAGNSHYLDNLATISMPHEARVLLDLIPHYYDRPGRIVQVLGETDKKPKEVMLNAPFIQHPQTGKPVQVPTEQLQGGQAPPKGMKQYDLKKGSYAAVVSIGKNYESRLQEGSDEIGRVLEAAPDLLKIIGDIYFKFRDFPGHQEIADRMRRMVPPEVLGEQEGDDNDPEALKAKLGQMQQSFGQLKQAFGDAMKQLETKQVEAGAKIQSEQVKAQAAMQLAQMKQEGEERLAQIDAMLKIRIAEIESAMDERKAAVDLAGKKALQDDQQAHEIALVQVEHAMTEDLAIAAHQQAMETLGVQQSHEQASQAVDHAVTQDEAAAGREHESGEAEAARAHASEEDEAGRAFEGEQAEADREVAEETAGDAEE